MEQHQTSEMMQSGIAQRTEQSVQIPAVRRNWLIILASFVICGLIPETIVTSSTSVLKIIRNPFSLIFVAFFYGAFDLFVRDAMIHRKYRWSALVLFGAAFGFFNEGVASGTWYTVHDTGTVFWGPVNPTIVVGYTVFHIFFSVFLPIATINAVFPQQRQTVFLGKISTRIVLTAFGIVTLALTIHSPVAGIRIGVFIAAVGFVFIAQLLPPAREKAQPTQSPPTIRKIIATGFSAILTYFIALYIIPQIDARVFPIIWAQAANMIIMIALAMLWAILLYRWLRHTIWTRTETLALITGIFSFTALLTVILPFFWAYLEPMASIPALIFVIVLLIRSTHQVA